MQVGLFVYFILFYFSLFLLFVWLVVLLSDFFLFSPLVEEKQALNFSFSFISRKYTN